MGPNGLIPIAAHSFSAPRVVLLCAIFAAVAAFYVFSDAVRSTDQSRELPAPSIFSEPAFDSRPAGGSELRSGAGRAAPADDVEIGDVREPTCAEVPQDCVFTIVADTRVDVRLASIRSNAPQILTAIDAREDKPVGVNLFAAVNVADVVLVSGQSSDTDAYHVVFENSEGKKTLLLELSSLGVDGDGYERLAFESMLAYSSAVDRSLFITDTAGAPPSDEFPYAVYPPVSFAFAQEKAGEKLRHYQPVDRVATLTVPRATTGEQLWQNALGYEMSALGERGESGGTERLWVDAFSGIAFTQADLDQILVNESKRRSLIENLDSSTRAELARAGKLESFVLTQVPHTRKEIERIASRNTQSSP